LPKSALFGSNPRIGLGEILVQGRETVAFGLKEHRSGRGVSIRRQCKNLFYVYAKTEPVIGVSNVAKNMRGKATEPRDWN
jgi:hypothetical protein